MKLNQKLLIRFFFVLFVYFLCLSNVESREDISLIDIETKESNQLKKQDPLRTLAGFGLSVFPGVLVHGLGHYYLGQQDAFWKLFYLELMGLTSLIAGAVPLAFTASAGILAPVYIPLIAFGFFAFVTSWILDIMGTLEIHAILERHKDPYKRTLVEAAYIFHQDTETDYANFIRSVMQWSHKRIFLKFYLEQEREKRYQKISILSGLNVFHNKVNNLYWLVEGNRERSSEDFAIGTVNSSMEMATNGGFISRTLENVTLINGIGIGRQWFFFEDDLGFGKSDLSLANLSLKHGIRLNIASWFIFESCFFQIHESMVAGFDFVMGVFQEKMEIVYRNFFVRADLLHGRGYRLTISLGVGI